MTTISPVRVSIYAFSYQNTQPLVSLLADVTHLSLPQTRIAVTSGLQAIVAALLAYRQRHSASAVSKNLFANNAVKKLRQYNAMNFATLGTIAYQRNDVALLVFEDNAHLKQASTYIAGQVESDESKVQTLLNYLTLIVLRELAILVEYGQLNHDELDKWFLLQPQFLSIEALNTTVPAKSASIVDNHLSDVFLENQNPEDHHSTQPLVDASDLPPFDHYWYELSRFKPAQDSRTQDMQQATPNYLKVIGRSAENLKKGHHDDMLVFSEMPNIVLPHQRWLLQLAKISEIYLSRNHLRIASEPDVAPTKPFVNLSMISGNDDAVPATTSETPIEYAKPRPLWKNPTIAVTLLVIAILSALALLKYQLTQPDIEATANDNILEAQVEESTVREQQDVAIVRVDEAAANDP